MPQLKYDKNGNPYYDAGFAGGVESFMSSFMQSFQMAQQMKDQEEARRQMRRKERVEYDTWTPERQKDFVEKATDQDLLDLGLAVEVPEAERDSLAPVPGSKKTKKLRTGQIKLKDNIYRDKTLQERGADAQAQALVNTAVKGADLAIVEAESRNALLVHNLKAGKFQLSKDIEDDATKKMYMASGDPIYMSIATGRPAAEFHEDLLRKKFPELAFRQDQIKFNIGPQARIAGEVTFRNQAEERYRSPGDAKRWADAMVSAMYDGDFSKMRDLPANMKTYAAEQLSLSYERLALDKQQVLQSEQHFLQNQAQQLVSASGASISMDTAMQWVKKNMYGSDAEGKPKVPMSPEATKQIEAWQSTLEASRQAAAATAYWELQLKRGKSQEEARSGLRSTLGSLISMHKELGGKPLEQQAIAVKDQLIKMEAEALGLDLTGATGNFWSEAIWNAAKGTVGVGTFMGSAVVDAGASQASIGGRIVQDVIGPTLMNQINTANFARGQANAPLGNAIISATEYFTDPEGKSIDWALSGTKLGNSIRAVYEKTPGLRIVFEENLKSKQQQWKVEFEATTDPLVAEDRIRKIAEVNEILRGMGVK